MPYLAIAAPASAHMPAAIPLIPLSEIKRLDLSISRLMSFTSWSVSVGWFSELIKSTLKHKVNTRIRHFQMYY